MRWRRVEAGLPRRAARGGKGDSPILLRGLRKNRDSPLGTRGLRKNRDSPLGTRRPAKSGWPLGRSGRGPAVWSHLLAADGPGKLVPLKLFQNRLGEGDSPNLLRGLRKERDSPRRWPRAKVGERTCRWKWTNWFRSASGADFLFQSSEIYGGLQGFWDYGPLGVELKRNVKRGLVARHGHRPRRPGRARPAPRRPIEMIGLDCTIIMHPQVWKCSGHYDLFHDFMVDCRESKRRYRHDQVRGRWVEAQGPADLRRQRSRRRRRPGRQRAARR